MAKVLIVDDDLEITGILGEILRREGHEVETAHETVDGMKKARSLRPDLIILDYHMPGATGAHLFESLRRNSASAHTPILFMSGEASPDLILKEIAEDSDSRFLPKPICLEDFRKAVDEVLASHKHG